MKTAVIDRLLAINHQFYQQFAADFDATRQRLQPGVERFLDEINLHSRILDLGCGNGAFRRVLLERGHRGAYTGLDVSPRLLSFARAQSAADPQARFLLADLGSGNWDAGLTGPFDLLTAFAVFHHLPPALLTRVLLKARRLVERTDTDPPGRLVFSTWQFLKSKRLQERIQPWDRVGLDPNELGPGDYLLDWRRGGLGYRYVHHYEIDELARLAERGGFSVKASFSSDGREGYLALYQAWEPSLSPLELVMLNDLDREQVSGLLALLRSCFPEGEWPAENPEGKFLAREAARLAAGVIAKRALVWQDGKPAAHAAILNREIGTAGGPLGVGAVTAVCVAEDRRLSGLGTRAMRRLFDLVDAEEYPVALWQTERVGFYEKLGARVVENRWVNSQDPINPDADPWPDETKMIYPADYEWPDGTIDLNGPPF